MASGKLRMLHSKCRNTRDLYLRSNIKRMFVPDDKVDWGVEWPEYYPPDHNDPSIFGKIWADQNLSVGESCKWNQIDGKVNRCSYIRDYTLDTEGRPLNPQGRTGLRGRGILGRWGPNHAADPIVTRIHDGVLQFVAIKRQDTGEWAIPGGMVDAGEVISETLRREFAEEALDCQDVSKIKSLWNHGTELYKGYVDDPRNTDNAWMETVATNFHDQENVLENVNLKAGDDAVSVRWIDVDDNTLLYASHKYFISLLRDHHKK
ncbi:unnamed protein product [Auanema sp. JU1783]|nr:unnamed protein product [Auanema sp. JU1783]